MANLNSDRNPDVYRIWDREALTFWQELALAKSERKVVDSSKKLELIWWEQSHNFWEELAMQRA